MKTALIKFNLLLGALAFTNVHAACEKKVIVVRQLERTGIVCIPEQASAAAMPLLFAFHGHGSNAKEMADGTQLHEAWPDALVVYLNGLTGTPTPNDQAGKKTGWQINPGDMNDRDVAFVDEALVALSRRYRIDQKKIYATGHSNGARFIGVLWALRGKKFASFAFSAAQADSLMDNAEPRSALMAMGVHDDVVPFSWQKNSLVMDLKKLSINEPASEQAGIKQYKNRDGIELVSFIHNGGHIWPPEQTAMFVEFFKRHTLSDYRSQPSRVGETP